MTKVLQNTCKQHEGDDDLDAVHVDVNAVTTTLQHTRVNVVNAVQRSDDDVNAVTTT